jgi:hypothetical protein
VGHGERRNNVAASAATGDENAKFRPACCLPDRNALGRLWEQPD